MDNSFLQIVTDNLIRKANGITELGKYTLVFPMQRAGLFVKQYLSQVLQQSAQPKPITLPRMTTIDSLTDSLCPMQNEDEISAICRLYQIYKKHTSHSLPIDAFYGWGLQLLNDFSSVAMASVKGDNIMRCTAEINRYENSGIDDETRERLEKLLAIEGNKDSIHDYFASLWENLPAIYHEFRESQEQQNLGSQGDRTQWVIQHWNDDCIQTKIKDRQYAFIGFNYLLTAEWQLMKLFHDNGQALFYWDDDPSFELDGNVYKYIHENIRHFPNALDCPAEEKRKVPQTTVVACQSDAAQAQFVHDWLEQTQANSAPGDKTAIVIAKESLLQQVVYALPGKPNADPQHAGINITKGYSLRNTQMFAQVNTLMDNQLRQEQTPEQMLKQLIAQMDEYYHQLPHEAQSWQTVLTDEAYYQTQCVLRQIYSLLQKNDIVKSELSNLRVLRNMIRRKLELVTIPFHGEPITDIQVIGVLETRLLDFDHILILNAEEGVIPQQSNENSYLPYDLRREYGMATREEENRIYAYNFFRLFRRAKDVTLTFSDSFTDTGKHTMSRFVMQMLCADKHNQIQRYRLTESEQLEPFAIPPTYWCETDVAPSALSPSGISEYITCPRWFYLDKIRHTDSSDTTPIVLEQNTLGDLLHSTMKNAYLDICGIPLSDSRELDRPYEITADAIDKYLKDAHRLSDALDIAYREENDNYQKHHTMGADEPLPYIRADHEVENHIVLTMARKILSQDKAMSPFTLVWLEHPVSATIGGMHIHGIIDRMDIIQREGQQRLRILDYKTGGFDEKKISFQIDELIKDPVKRYALQTLIYSELSNNSRPDAGRDLPIMPELLFTRKMSADGRLQISPADKGGEPMYIMDYMADCRKDFLPKLEEVFRQILDNMQPGKEFVMQEDIKQCADSYCPFHQLCGRKKKEWK